MTKQDPIIDHGFHAVIPRIVRTDYKNLTATQKWLYVCLKDLAGETGTCFRCIRTLEEETGISTGMISQSIHALHRAGLIHAEMKKRSNGGKPVWHITIADIWGANGETHPTKRSHSEQTTEIVHCVNKNVQQVNEKNRERSHSERERSLCETEEGKEKKDHFEEGKEKKVRTLSPVPPPSQEGSTSSPSLPQKEVFQLTDEQADFWTRWCAIAGAQKLNETAKKHVVVLSSSIRTTEDLQSLYAHSYAHLKALAQEQGKAVVSPRLGNLVNALPEWQQIQARKQQEKEQATHKTISGSGRMTNWTATRMAGEAPPLNYEPLPASGGLSQVGNISTGLQERIRQARERRKLGSPGL